jgi:predicted transcriptional regulator with HTH domain
MSRVKRTVKTDSANVIGFLSGADPKEMASWWGRERRG